MGRRKKVTVIEEPEDNDEILSDELEKEPGEIEDENAVSRLQESFGGKQYRLRLSKFNPDTNDWELCDVVPLERFDPIVIGKKWGGGKYRGILVDSAQKFVKGGTIHFSIATPLESDTPAPTDPFQNPMVGVVIESMKSQQAMLMEVLKSFAPQAANAANAANQMTPMQMLEMLKHFQSMLPSERGGNDLEKILGLQLKLRDLMDSGKDDDGPAAGGAFAEIVEAVKLLKESQNLMGPRPPMRPPQRLVIPNAPNGPSATKTQLEEKEDMFAEVKNSILFYVPKFVQGALEHAALAQNGQMDEANENIDRWAGFLINVLETETIPLAVKKMRLFIKNADQAWDFLIEWADDREKVEKIFAAAPELAPHHDWALAVVAAAVAEITEEENPDEPVPGEPVPIVVHNPNGDIQ